MTTAVLARLIGTYARLRIGGLNVNVEIIDARISFGNLQLQVTPKAGNDASWVSADRCSSPELEGVRA